MKNKLKKFAALLLSMAMLSASMAIPALASSSVEISGITGNEQDGIESMTVSVNGTAEKGGKGIAAVYSKDGTLKKVYFSKTNIEKGSTEGDYILNFDDGLKAAEDEQVKVFLWAIDDENGLTEQPLTEAFAPAEEPENSYADFGALSAETKLFPTDTITVGDLTENVAFTQDTENAKKINVTGALNYVENYPSMGENAQTHYYLPFAVSGLNENAVVYLESKEDFTDTIDGKNYKKITSDSFDNAEKTVLYAVRAVDSEKKSFTVMVDLDGDGEAYVPTTYTIDVSGLVFTEKTSAAAIGTLAADTVLYEKTAADLADNLVLTADAENAKKINAAGTLKYVSEYPSMGDKAQTHYYLPFAVSGLNENAVVYFESDVDYTDTIDGKNYKKITSESFDNAEKTVLYAVRAVDSDKKSFTVAVDLDGDGKEYAPATYTIDVSALDLEQVYSLTGTVDENISAVKLYQNDEIVVTAEPQQAEDGTYTVTFSDIKAGDYALSAEVKEGTETEDYVIDYIKVGDEEKNTITVGENAVSFEIKSKIKTYTVSAKWEGGSADNGQDILMAKLLNKADKTEIMGTIDYEKSEIVFSEVPNGKYTLGIINSGDSRSGYNVVTKIESTAYESGLLTVNKADVSDLKFVMNLVSPGDTDTTMELTGFADENVKKVFIKSGETVASEGTAAETADDDGTYTLNFKNKTYEDKYGYEHNLLTIFNSYTVEVYCKDGYIPRIFNNNYWNDKIYIYSSRDTQVPTGDIIVTAEEPVSEDFTITNELKEADAENNNGYISVREKAQAGACVHINTNPNDNCIFKNLKVQSESGEELPVSKVDDNLYIFTMPEENITISADVATVYKITDVSEQSGNVKFMLNGEEVTCAEENDVIEIVSAVDGKKVTSASIADDTESAESRDIECVNNSYTFTMPANDVKITAAIGQAYEVDFGNSSDGIRGWDFYINGKLERYPRMAAAGDKVWVKFTLKSGYQVKKISYTNGGYGSNLIETEVSPDESGNYVFIMPEYDVNIYMEAEAIPSED